MAADDITEASNGKILTATQGVKINHLIEQQDKLIKKFDGFVDRFDRHLEQANHRDNRLTSIEVRCEHVEKDVCDQADKLDDVRIKSNRMDGVVAFFSALFAAIATYFGVSK